MGGAGGIIRAPFFEGRQARKYATTGVWSEARSERRGSASMRQLTSFWESA